MIMKHVLGLIIVGTPLISAGLAGAGWGWENVATKGSPLAGGTQAVDMSLEVPARAVREGRDAEALAMIRDAAATHPTWPPARLVLARLQFAANQPAKGRRTLEQAAAETPADPRVYLALGSLAMGEGRYSDARLNGERALALLEGTKLDAESARTARREACAGLAAVAEAMDDWPSARTHLLAWLASDPGNAPARQRLGRALFRLGKTEEAFQELTHSVKDDPKLGPAAVPMALLFVQSGNAAKAEEWFNYASRVEPKSSAVRLAHARWRLDQGRAAEARSLVEEAARLDPRSKEIEPLRGLVAWQLRELATAERIFEGLHRDYPTEAGFGALLALAMVEQNDIEKRSRGLQVAEDNVRKSPGAVDALASLGRAHARSGHLDEAERLLRAAIAGSGGQATPTIAYFLAQVRAERGLADDARGLLTPAAASPVAFAYQADARKLLASLGEKGPVKPPPPGTSRPMATNP
jgi:tetratricopeptide (TPR) repeat protein